MKLQDITKQRTTNINEHTDVGGLCLREISNEFEIYLNVIQVLFAWREECIVILHCYGGNKVGTDGNRAEINIGRCTQLSNQCARFLDEDVTFGSLCL